MGSDLELLKYQDYSDVSSFFFYFCFCTILPLLFLTGYFVDELTPIPVSASCIDLRDESLLAGKACFDQMDEFGLYYSIILLIAPSLGFAPI